MSELPEGWTKGPVREFVALHDNRRIPLNAKQREGKRGNYPYYGANGLVDHVDDYLFDGEYTLLAEDGGYFDDPKRGVAYEVSGKFWVNNHAHILEPLGGISNRFLQYRLNAFNWMPFVGGTTRLKLTQGGLQQAQMALPPLPEQRRIVAKIDSLTAKSNRARDQLDYIPRLVEKYKQAIMAAAFRGELTRRWRQKNREMASWQNVVLKDIAEIQSGIALGKKRTTASHLIRRPYLRVANVQRGWLDLTEMKEIDVTEQEATRLYLRPGDILMNEGGDRDKLGRGWVWQGQIENCIHQNHVFRVRLFDRTFPPQLISRYANEFGQAHFFDEGKQTTNLASISKTKLSSLPLPLPPVNEAIEMLRCIETAFAWIDRLVSEATSARKLIDHLDQSLLGKAFRGELVPQDPNDEPANVLLERIRAERAAAPAKLKRKPR